MCTEGYHYTCCDMVHPHIYNGIAICMPLKSSKLTTSWNEKCTEKCTLSKIEIIPLEWANHLYSYFHAPLRPTPTCSNNKLLNYWPNLGRYIHTQTYFNMCRGANHKCMHHCIPHNTVIITLIPWNGCQALSRGKERGIWYSTSGSNNWNHTQRK